MVGNNEVERRMPYDIEVDKKEVGQRIKNIRMELGITLEELGDKLGVKKPSVWHWENGRNLPNKRRLKTIADLADISVEELLHGTKSCNWVSILVEKSKITYESECGQRFELSEKDLPNYNYCPNCGEFINVD